MAYGDSGAAYCGARDEGGGAESAAVDLLEWISPFDDVNTHTEEVESDGGEQRRSRTLPLGLLLEEKRVRSTSFHSAVVRSSSR